MTTPLQMQFIPSDTYPGKQTHWFPIHCEFGKWLHGSNVIGEHCDPFKNVPGLQMQPKIG